VVSVLESGDVADFAFHGGGYIGAHPEDLGRGGARRFDGGGDVFVGLADLVVDFEQVNDVVAGQLVAGLATAPSGWRFSRPLGPTTRSGALPARPGGMDPWRRHVIDGLPVVTGESLYGLDRTVEPIEPREHVDR
jgi:hypothetical protein